MQYLLTEEEYKTLQARAKHGDNSPTKEDLRKFCTFVADNMPAGVEWIGIEKPWGCILSKVSDWYCDSCPSRIICPNPHKSWSK
jgi:hypothetical protein